MPEGTAVVVAPEVPGTVAPVVVAQEVAAPAVAPVVAVGAGSVPDPEVVALRTELTRVREAMDGVIREREVYACRNLLVARLAATGLAGPVQAKLRKRFDGDVFTAEALEGAIGEEAEMLAGLAQLGHWGGGGLVTGQGAARVASSPAAFQREVVQLAWDRLLGVTEAVEAPLLLQGVRVPDWRSIREAYVQTTGDAGVSGFLRPELSIAREANEVTTTILNEVVLNSLTKKLIQDYRGQPQDWRRFCVVSAVNDFKRQDRISLQDFAALSIVAEGGAYTNLAWGDSRETYTPSKRGNLVVITREVILNDDIHAVRQIPQKLAISAGITINEFVYTTLIAGNPTMADGTKVYDDGVQTSHGNRGTAALSSSALTNAIAAMLKQTNSAGKRVGVRPRFLLVPPDLWATANVLVGSTLVPGSANNDVNVLRGLLEPIVVPQFTDVNDYYLFADAQVMPTIELGFVQGKEVPELLLQDQPVDGQVFTNDQISYKIRHEYSGAFLGYQGTFWGNVAG